MVQRLHRPFLTLKMEEEAISQGMRWPLEAGKAMKTVSTKNTDLLVP
jgi:hypothetical protein